ncbi:MAG: hypothetical protein KF799_03320 [Bdellovibrionales bacterium]|nr:hypothetical protein [Bdellovibrionales bacterium]
MRSKVIQIAHRALEYAPLLFFAAAFTLYWWSTAELPVADAALVQSRVTKENKFDHALTDREICEVKDHLELDLLFSPPSHRADALRENDHTVTPP